MKNPKKKAMGKVLAEVSKAYLDSVSIKQPLTATAEVGAAVETVLGKLERIGISRTAFRTKYAAGDLSLVAVTKEIDRLMQ